MPCTLCPHTGCPHSFMRMRVTACPECEDGTIVLDPVSGPRWRLDCNTCSFLIYLPETLHAVKLSKKRCQACPMPLDIRLPSACSCDCNTLKSDHKSTCQTYNPQSYSG